MEIKPTRPIKNVDQSGVDADDLLEKPTIKFQKTSIGKSAFSFTNNKLAFEGKDVGQMIAETAKQNPHLLAEVAGGLERFKEECLKRKKNFFKSKGKKEASHTDEELGQIFALCDAYITRIGELIKKQYDQTQDGMTVTLDEDGQLNLNQMNVHALVERCREDPNPKALVFIKGVRSRLNRLLENRSNSSKFDRMRDVILDLLKEVDSILKKNKTE